MFRHRERPELSPVGKTESIYPYCEHDLKQKAGRKKKCPHCGELIYVRTRPSDRQRVLVTEMQAEPIDEQWAIINGTHKEYLTRKEQFGNTKGELTNRWGREPSDNVVRYHLLNRSLTKHAQEQQWGLFRNAKLEMAEILSKESDPRNALEKYLEACYLDLNGPSNIGVFLDQDEKRTPILHENNPPRDPKIWGDLAPVVVGRLSKLIEKTETDRDKATEMFLCVATLLEESLQLPLSPQDAGKTLAAEMHTLSDVWGNT